MQSDPLTQSAFCVGLSHIFIVRSMLSFSELPKTRNNLENCYEALSLLQTEHFLHFVSQITISIAGITRTQILVLVLFADLK